MSYAPQGADDPLLPGSARKPSSRPAARREPNNSALCRRRRRVRGRQVVHVEKPAFAAVADLGEIEDFGDRDPGFALRRFATQLHIRCRRVISDFRPLPELAGGSVTRFYLRSRQHTIEIFLPTA